MKTTQAMLTVILAVTLGAIAATAAIAAEPTITLQTLLNEMVDREAAARFPDPAYTCVQASSYDRASVSADEPGSWMANNDRSFFIREETIDGRLESVMLDADGPGCIVRFWATSGNPAGNIRVYLDGSDEPVINKPAKTLVGGDALVGPPLSEVCARGMNFYLPIPYAKHCKITYDRPNFHKSGNGDDLLYYQINYRTYEADAKVESFTQQGFDAAKAKIANLQEALLKPDTIEMGRFRYYATPLAPGAVKTVASYDQTEPSAIRRLEVQLEANDLAAAARSTVLSIEFDGQQTVWCPVGDFFGSGVGINPYRGWWRQIGKDGWMACYWPMPFQKSCNIELKNIGDQDVTVAAHAVTTPWQWDDRSMYFHTNWRLEQPIDASKKFDWNYLEATGKGVFMGDTLAVYNPVPGWWGEGDEKIYVDSEKFPSHFGTGTEDYYGYAWCTPAFFNSPFHCQPLAEGPRNQGHVTNTRVRLLDGIPFTKQFRFDMEVWHWVPVNVVYAATTHWYGMPGAKGNYGPMPELA
ncbi:MAG TPA: glycoside hydrolase family 172 protein, partial [Thermoguttaceae bacterium]|nr:glycoside hydrolase family 172 protein [Thermoguttaceae bacterium]